MCDDPAASNPFLWQLHRATLNNLVRHNSTNSTVTSNNSVEGCHGSRPSAITKPHTHMFSTAACRVQPCNWHNSSCMRQQ